MDDLLDLDWGKQSQQPKPASVSPTTSQAQIPASWQRQPPSSNYNFDVLTRSLHTPSPTPSATAACSSPSQQASAAYKPSVAARPSAIRAPSSSGSGLGGDAFSSLLSFGGGSSAQNGNLTMAERQRLATEQAQQQAEKQRRELDARWGGGSSAHGSEEGFWDQMGSSGAVKKASNGLGASSPASTDMRRPAVASKAQANDSRHSPAATSKAPADPWDFDTFASSSADAGSSSAKSSATRSQPAPARCREPVPDLFDFDQLDDGSSSFVSGAASGGNDTTDDADDDILGALSKPVSSLQIDSSSSDVRRAARGSSASSAHSSRVPSPASGSRPSGAAGRKPKTSATRSFSPPPHIIGQIVEMGFSPQEARAALAETETGLDVQAALDALLGQAGAEGGDGHDDGFGRGMEEDDRQIALELQRQEEAERAYAARAEAQAAEEREAERRRRRRTGPSRESTGAASPPSEGRLAGRQRPEGGRPGAAEGAAAAGGDWQEHADRLYAQATELGTNVFSRANAFWSSAKAQAQKALEERNARAAAAAAEGRADASSPAEGAKSRRWGVGAGAARNKEWEGKPKWMQDAEAAAAAEEAGAGGAGTGGAAEGAGAGGFKDSDDEGGGEGAISLPVAEGRERRRVRPQESSPAAETLPEEQDSSVLGGDADIWDSPAEPVGAPKPTAAAPPVPSRRPATEERPAYASPARRAAGGRSSAPKPARAAAAPPAPLRERNLVPEDTAATSSSAEHKAAGNASFKQGAYGDAEAAYTRAIDVLPDASLRRVPLFNNRANARLKNGDSAAALKDCDAVLALIVPASSEEPTPRYYPQQEAPLPASLTDAGVNLRDAWAKALLRRAQAKEALERWAPARKDWEALMAFEKEEGSGRLGVQNLRAAQDGNARCGKMLGDASKPGPARSTGASRSAKAAAASAAARAEEAAVQRVRADTAAANAEDAARLSLKDAIDARVAAWKAGKDTNVRALVASLDSVVWPELGWKKVGMHELITDAQVKKGYTRAIARLHPDKLTPNNTTLEQRMIGAAVFSALNDAWIASKPA